MMSRQLLSTSRRTAVSLRNVRLYSDSRSEGSVAQSKGFSKKEKAHEDQYINAHEQAQLAKLKAQIEAKQAELDALEAKAAKEAQKVQSLKEEAEKK